MQTDRIKIDNTGTGMKEALADAERTAEYLKVSKKNAIMLRLLTEEAIGMVRAVTGSFHGEFWIEVKDGNDCGIHIRTEDKIDYYTKQDLISLSASGKNESEKGFMGKLMGLMSRGLHSIDEVNRMQIEYGGSPMMFGTLGMGDISPGMDMSVWSLTTYRTSLQTELDSSGEESDAGDALEDLERSIVASIADDVKVYIRSGDAEIVIEKKLSGAA